MLLSPGRRCFLKYTSTKWFQRFKCGNFDLHDDEPPVEKEELERLLEEDPCRTPLELTEKLEVTHPAASRRLRKLGRIQKEGRWVPGQLTDENKSSVMKLLCRGSLD